MLIAFHKPYGVLSQFTSHDSKHRTLAAFNFPADVYPLGRLDADSEGLLLLSDEPLLNGELLNPVGGHMRHYWVEVERRPSIENLTILEAGVKIQDYRTLPCRARILDPQPVVPERHPPIRFRKNVPTCWLAVSLREGKNRQVRRMTASIGHPTLRLMRVQIGRFALDNLAPGQWKLLGDNERALVLAKESGNCVG
jgi:23S rRNA pseudouridine2457 synthase